MKIEGVQKNGDQTLVQVRNVRRGLKPGAKVTDGTNTWSVSAITPGASRGLTGVSLVGDGELKIGSELR
jgi:hypothetical protein